MRMIICDHEQGTDEWKKARLGVFTASRFKEILTPKTRAISKNKYARQMAAEIIQGYALDDFEGNAATQRGHDLEPLARDAYQFICDLDFAECGLIYGDETKNFGASPDGVNFEEKKGLEIKCYGIMRCLDIHENNILPFDDQPQVYGNLYVSGFDTWDYFLFHPALKPLYFTVKKTDKDYKDWLKKFIPALEDKIVERDKIIKKFKG